MKKTFIFTLIAGSLLASSTVTMAANLTGKLSALAGYRLIRPTGLSYSAAEIDLGYRFFNTQDITLTAVVDMYQLPVSAGSSVKQLESSVGVVGDYSFADFNGIRPFVSGGLNYIFTSQPVVLGMQFGAGVAINSSHFWPIRVRVDQFYWDTYRKDLRGAIQVDFPMDAPAKPKAVEIVPTPAPVVVPTPAPVAVVPTPAPVPVAIKVPTPPVIILDTDNDGVPNKIDECPQTPQGVTVDAFGCAVDTDKDGVADYEDTCPTTEANAVVDKTGCAIGIKNTVQFDRDKATINSKYDSLMEEIVKLMNENPKVTIELQGYADQTGSKAYNLQLSLQRAKAVETSLINKYKIDKSRLTTIGFGSDKPVIASQVKAENGVNRRVEVRVLFNTIVEPTATH